jgi:hypothetical protein
MAALFNIPAPAVAAEAGPYVFAAGDITNPYAMTWDAYSRRLKPYLDDNYPVRAQTSSRMEQPAPAQEGEQVPPAAEAVKTEISRIKKYLDNQERRPPTYKTQQVNEAVNKAARSDRVNDIAGVMPFNVNAYRIAILAQLNANAPGGFKYQDVGP